MATHNASKSSEHKSAMAALLAAHKDQFRSLHKGEVVSGKLTKLSAHEILVDLGAKTEALVLEKDKGILHTLLATFKVGDTVEVSVLNPESDSGQPVVSLRRYLGKLSWDKLEHLLKTKEAVEVTVAEIAKAGYVVDTPFGISGFLPQSRISFAKNQDVVPGSKITVTALELNRKDNKVIFSQQAALSEEEFKALEKRFKPNEKVSVTVTNVTPNGLYVVLAGQGDVPQLEGTIHVSEISWEKVGNLVGMYTVGQSLEAVLLRLDPDSRKAQFSVKRLTADPFEEILKNYPVDKKVSGKVSSVDENGVTISLDEGIEGIIRKEKIPPTTSYTVGQTVTALVSEHDKKRHKIILVPVLLEKPIGYR
jgi:ribosomal protein S1